ncbi:MAG: hypothetical protein GXP55_16945 [Deltaproteobacteria bacterium]|nr:hypothetical protein [Deltaproteobacteria bacterium]
MGHSATRRAPDGSLIHEVRSTGDSLRPTARLLRDNASVLLPNNGPIRWSFTGNIEEFNPNGDVLGTHDPVPHDTTLVRFATSNQLQRDQNRLPDSLKAMLAGSGCAASDFPGGWHGDSICTPPDGTIPGGGGGFIQDSIVSNAVLLQNGLPDGVPTFELSWDENSPPDQPVLRLDTNFRVRVVRGWLGRVLFRSMRAQVRFAHLIAATPCGAGSATGEPCADNDTILFSGYRAEALRLGADARAPGQALNFGVCSEAVETSAQVEIGLRCPLFVNQILSSVPGWIPGSAWYLCRRAARGLRRSIRGSLCDTAANLEQMMKLAVTPPTFRLTLKDALMATVPSPDTDGDGVLSPGELRSAIESLPQGRGQGLAISQVADLIHVTLEAYADINALGTEAAQTNVLITGEDGSFTDAAVVAFARGSTIRVTRARGDLQQVRDACAQGATYIMCDVCATGPNSFCDGPNLVASVDLTSAVASVDDFHIQKSPHLAKLLSTAPLFGDRLRALFARPLPPGAHYIRATSVDRTPGVPGDMEARFEYILDRDKDGIADETDNCPETPNLDQANSDADGWGDACDLCPGIDNARAPGQLESGAFGDLDIDGIPNACDCDANGNDCIDHTVGVTLSGERIACSIRQGATFENSDARYLDGSLEGNFDGDAFLDVCDADLDDDGVLNRDDNCPRGDGDGIWNPSVDTNPDQTDSGGSALGDLCDPVCAGPGGGLGCGGGAGGPAGGSAGHPAGSGIYWRGTPGANECVGQTCTIGSLGFCMGQQADACGSFGAIELFTGIGQAEATLTPTALNLDAGFGTKVIQTSFDWDGDGQGELLVSSPLASAGGSPYDCPITRDCVPFNLPEAGSVMVLASTDGHALLRLDGSQAYAHFGQGLALADTTLAVGAPGMASNQTADGAVYVYDLVNGAAHLRSEVTGQPGDGLGQDVSVADATWPPLFLAGAPNAAAGAGAILAIDTNQGESARFASSVPGAGLSRGVMVQRANGGWVVVGGAPSAYAGDGALFFFRDNGRDRVVRGQASEELGASLYANAESLGPNRLVVGAPGRDGGAGAIHVYAAGGRRVATRVYWGARVGSALASSGDLDGDGKAELWVGMTVGGERRSVAFAIPSRQ